MTDAIDNFPALRKGLLELVVLTVISGGRLYAGEILHRLEETPFVTQEGTLYPLLGKLRRDGLLDYEWVESDAGPPRKYYALAAAGETRLAALTNYFTTITTTISTLGAPQ